MKASVWLNLHVLPHEEYVIECRQKDGYGMRWTTGKSKEFRGFLEPPMADGHEKGWKH